MINQTVKPIISVQNLKRTYHTKVGLMNQEKKIVEALKGINFDIYPGEIFGLLGPNGAGKTTTIKILTTLLAPTDGSAQVLGYETFGQEKHIRSKINFIFGGERSLYWRLSAEDNLKFFADLYKIPRREQPKLIDGLLDQVGLSHAKRHKVETYSKGMKQRLQIARALLNNPEVIFLDEPSLGLDPVGARELKQIVKNIANQGKTVLLTTHYMQEAEELCDRIAIINHGELIALDTVDGLKSRITEQMRTRIKQERLNQIKDVEISLEDVYIELIGGQNA